MSAPVYTSARYGPTIVDSDGWETCLWSICGDCGAVIADETEHNRFHRRNP